MKKIYIVRKYVKANSIQEAIKIEKTIEVADCWLSEHSTNQLQEELSPRKEEPVGFAGEQKKKL